MALEAVHELSEPCRLRLRVVVEQGDVPAASGLDTAVVRCRKAEVGAKLQHAHVGEMLAHELERPVRGAVVGHDHLVVGVGLRGEARQAALEVGATVPVGDDDAAGYVRHRPPARQRAARA